jgi:hypothetical protein
VTRGEALPPGSVARNLDRRKALTPARREKPAPQERVMDRDTAKSIESEPEQKSRIDKERDRALDKALEETFPGSDPVNVTQPPKSKHERRNEKSDTSGGRSA